MLSRLAAVTSVLALTAVGLIAPSVPAAPAEAASSPKLSFVTRPVTTSTSCGTQTFNVRVPVLSGSTQKNQDVVTTWGDWMRADLVARATTDADSCQYLLASLDEQVGEGSVYKGRYVSVMTRWRADTIGNLNTMTLDLKTGKTVGVGTFASDKAKVFTWAKCLAFIKFTADLRSAFCPDDTGKIDQSISGWRVSASGIQLYGAYEDGYYASPTVPWSAIVQPSYTKAKKHTTTRVRTTNTLDGRVVERSTVTVQGNLVTLKKAKSSFNAAFTEYGVRGTGKTVVVFWPQEGPGGLMTDPMDDYYNDKVTFASASSTKAKGFEYVVMCAE